jgi:hypothetical protein
MVLTQVINMLWIYENVFKSLFLIPESGHHRSRSFEPKINRQNSFKIQNSIWINWCLRTCQTSYWLQMITHDVTNLGTLCNCNATYPLSFSPPYTFLSPLLTRYTLKVSLCIITSYHLYEPQKVHFVLQNHPTSSNIRNTKINNWK